MGRSKYGNVPTEMYGITFASKKEAWAYPRMQERVDAGEIINLVRQPKYELQPAFVNNAGEKVAAITYKPDFGYEDAVTGVPGVVEVKGGKGTQTQASRLRIKLFQYKYPHIRFELWDK